MIRFRFFPILPFYKAIDMTDTTQTAAPVKTLSSQVADLEAKVADLEAKAASRGAQVIAYDMIIEQQKKTIAAERARSSDAECKGLTTTLKLAVVRNELAYLAAEYEQLQNDIDEVARVREVIRAKRDEYRERNEQQEQAIKLWRDTARRQHESFETLGIELALMKRRDAEQRYAIEAYQKATGSSSYGDLKGNVAYIMEPLF